MKITIIRIGKMVCALDVVGVAAGCGVADYGQMMVTSAAISQEYTLSLTRDRTQC